ncbi:hypothetical protein ACIODT_35840 [Streptomyces sp. NPDC088251]|uniref:hypothetical protein n=1 Tax=unclassified Streptomyces TaxID=2593676 RepID=UPI0037F86D23
MEIEILVVPDCPNEKPAAEQLRRALDGLGLTDTMFTTRIIADQAEAERIGSTGSPTVLINGRDPFLESGRPAGLTCRVYRTAGRPTGLPGADQLREALISAL